MAAHLARVILTIGTVSAIYQGPLDVTVDGEKLHLHVVSSGQGANGKQLFEGHGDGVTLRWGGETRGFIAKTKTDDMPWDNYYNFSFFNKEFSYDVDLSSVGCSCNAALFFVTMPGYDESGKISPGQPQNPWYCDANDIGGTWCWEHDTIEANKYAMTVTPHTCNAAPGQYITECDRAGCSPHAHVNNVMHDPDGMCPEDRCKIDTRRPFRIFQSFQGTETTLTRIHHKMVQGENTFEWDSCNYPDYLARMTPGFKANMQVVFQLWGSDYETMTWLDANAGCTGACDQESTMTTFSNLAIRSLPPLAEEGATALVDTPLARVDDETTAYKYLVVAMFASFAAAVASMIALSSWTLGRRVQPPPDALG